MMETNRDDPRLSERWLPSPGIHAATEAEATFRFGTPGPQRRRLALRVRRWVELARKTRARRLLIDGSYVTAAPAPKDVDAVILLPADFDLQILGGEPEAVQLEEMLTTRRPEEIFAAEDERDWLEWIEFFSRTREADGRRKGLVEISL